MKLLIVGDVHWSTYSSIIRSRGNKYSTRLENLINSVNWVERLANDFNCDEIIYLGDFFDKPELGAEELTALKEINWSKKSHKLIVGNHESNINTLDYSSAFTLLSDNFKIINKVRIDDMDNDMQFIYLPYILDEDRETLNYLSNYLLSNSSKTIVFSHNDIKGIQYGAFESKTGYEIEDIENNCDIFFNGHLHNGGKVGTKNKIINVGNLTGQNFGEDASTYSHQVILFDTDTMDITYIENPYAFNFYKIKVESNELSLLNLINIKPNAVVSVTCCEDFVDRVKQCINNNSKIVESRVILESVKPETRSESTSLDLGDYISKFVTFITDTLGSDNVTQEELYKIVSGGN